MEESVIVDSDHKSLSRSHTVKIALIVAVIAVGILGYLHIQGKLFPRHEKSITIVAGSYRTSPLYVVTKDASIAVSVAVQGVQKKALDKVILKDGSTLYSLIETETPLTSNIYRVDVNGAATQLTNTATTKSALSLDPSGMHVVYEETVPKDPQQQLIAQADIIQLDLRSQVVERITQGVVPHYTHTGAIFVGQKDGLVVYPPHTSTATSGAVVLSPKIYSLYAVSSDGTLLASYNTKTAMIDVFTVTQTGTLAFVYSSKTEHPPLNLNFIDTDPVSIESTPSPKGVIYTISGYGAHKSQWNIISPQGPMAQRLLYVSK